MVAVAGSTANIRVDGNAALINDKVQWYNELKPDPG